MTGINHALTGAVVAAAINEPAVALPAALLSHFAADMVPHWDYKVRGGKHAKHIAMVYDLLLSMFLLLMLAIVVDATPWLVFAGGLLGIAPDLMWLPYFLTGKPSKMSNKKNWLHRVRRFHLRIQWSETARGAYAEALWFVLMVVIVLSIRH